MFISCKRSLFFNRSITTNNKKISQTHIYTIGKDFVNIDDKDSINLPPYKFYIIKLIKNMKLEKYFTFIGYANEEKMSNRFINSHIFVSSSTIENESNSISEAMITGVPVVSSYVGGVTNRLVHNKDGFMYPSDEPYMLAYYIFKIFKNNNIALKFSKNARKRALLTNDRNTNLKKIIDIYISLSKKQL